MAQNPSKTHQLLAKLLEPHCEIKGELYFNRLLTHLSNTAKTENGARLLVDWITEAAQVWESRGAPPHHIGAFALNITSIISENHFSEIHSKNTYTKLIQILRTQAPDTPPSIKLGYVKLLTSLLSHQGGFEIIQENDFWKDVLRFVLIKQTLYISRDGQTFISKMLEEALNYNEEFIGCMIKHLMLPMDEQVGEVSEEIVQEKLLPTVQVIANILEYFLQSTVLIERDHRIGQYFIDQCCLEEKIKTLLPIAQNPDIIFEFGRLLILIQLNKMLILTLSANMTLETSRPFIYTMLGVLEANITKGKMETVIRLCEQCQFYWNAIGYHLPCILYNRANEPMTFSNQLIIIQIVPIVALLNKTCFPVIKSDLFEEAELREVYLYKLFQLMCRRTVRLCYFWRDALMPLHNLFSIATKSLTYILKSRKYYSREQAALVLQVLIYFLKDMMRLPKEAPDLFHLAAKETTFLSLLFDGIVTLIEDFQLTWRDSIETLCVMAATCDFLTVPTWPSSLVVKALRVVNVAMAKYMTPNLALLIEGRGDATMAMIGPLLYAKTLDNAWEVRDSALEVICTISHMSNTKFPSLQKVLMDSDLPGIVVRMAHKDSESFVRATAIKCLQEMLRVEKIWNKSLKSAGLPDIMRGILLNETEGIVRVEAATFMCFAYEHQLFAVGILEDLFETMIHASLTDLHWEVRVSALAFWDYVIKDQLQHQGMVDGTFPSVTFSKENRKIVTLNDSEVRKRLQKILVYLSELGCLGVLVCAIKDDCDIEVAKKAVSIVQSLDLLVIKYHLREEGVVKECEMSGSATPSSSSGISIGSRNSSLCPGDDVIDDIVSARDSMLLRDVFIGNDVESLCSYELSSAKKIVSPEEFLRFVAQDLEAIVNEKKDWLNGIDDLDSLIDDMLKTYDENVNAMDCY